MATAEEVMQLLVRRIAGVMAVDPAHVAPDTRFDEDLHADSLDLVEVVEGVERDLRGRGERMRLGDAELLELRTVAQAAERIAGSSTVVDPEAR